MDFSLTDISDYLVLLNFQSPGEKAWSQDLSKMFAVTQSKFSKTVIFIFFSSFCLVDVLRSCNIRWISRSMLIKTFCFIGKSQRHFQSFHTSQCIVCMCLRCVRHWGFGKFLLCLWSCASCRTLGGGPWTSGASNLWKREDYKHPFIPFIHSFYQYLLSTYCMPGTILSSGI